VPNRAIRVASGRRSVSVLIEGEQIEVPVTLGLTNETYSEVSSGLLRGGDAVVLNPTIQHSLAQAVFLESSVAGVAAGVARAAMIKTRELLITACAFGTVAPQFSF